MKGHESYSGISENVSRDLRMIEIRSMFYNRHVRAIERLELSASPRLLLGF
jgi:hypothetical protein